MIVKDYKFGSITIDGVTYTKDVIIFSDHVLPNWRRREGHKLTMYDLEDVLAKKPDILVVGTGKTEMMKVPFELIQDLENKGITLQCYKTDEAVEKFNEYIDNDTDVVAALHLTC